MNLLSFFMQTSFKLTFFLLKLVYIWGLVVEFILNHVSLLHGADILDVFEKLLVFLFEAFVFINPLNGLCDIVKHFHAIG